MRLFLFLVLFSFEAYSEPKQPTFIFTDHKPICHLVDGKLVLAKKWPFGNWEDCAYSVLSAATQLDTQAQAVAKELAAEKAKCANLVPKK